MSSVKRREFLAGVAGASSLSLSGCLVCANSYRVFDDYLRLSIHEFHSEYNPFWGEARIHHRDPDDIPDLPKVTDGRDQLYWVPHSVVISGTIGRAYSNPSTEPGLSSERSNGATHSLLEEAAIDPAQRPNREVRFRRHLVLR